MLDCVCEIVLLLACEFSIEKKRESQSRLNLRRTRYWAKETSTLEDGEQPSGFCANVSMGKKIALNEVSAIGAFDLHVDSFCGERNCSDCSRTVYAQMPISD